MASQMSNSSKNSDQPIITYSADSSTNTNSKWTNFKNSFKPARPLNNDLALDLEKNASDNLSSAFSQLHQNLIGLAGCVGSGLLVVSGNALANGGPGSVLIGWALVSSFLYCTMQALSELASCYPVSGSFFKYADKFVSRPASFASGLNYFLFWLVVLPLELVAASLCIQFWNSKINTVAWVAIFYVLIVGTNIFGGTAAFANTELVAAIIKLLGVIGFDILAIILICGGAGEEGYIGPKYWHNPGAFNHGFKGFTTVLISATYSLAGTELVGLTVCESSNNPRIALPRAIKQVFYRIIVFYMFTLTLIGFLVPSNSDKLGGSSSDATASPFVIAINNGGIKVLPSIFNVVVIISLLSIGNSAVYGFSRTALSLAESKLLPSFFAYVDQAGRPLGGIIFAAVFGLLSFVSASPKQAEVFAWLVALSALSTLFTWASCTISHIRFRLAIQKQNRSLLEVPYLSKTGIWGSVYATICLVVVLCLQFWISLFPLGAKPNAGEFFKNYLGAVIWLACYLGYMVYARDWILLIPLDEIDLDSDRAETDADKLQQELHEEMEVLKSRPWYIRVYYYLF